MVDVLLKALIFLCVSWWVVSLAVHMTNGDATKAAWSAVMLCVGAGCLFMLFQIRA